MSRYRVEVDRNGCECCGCGKTWTVVDSADDVAIGQSFEQAEDAEALADLMNDAARDAGAEMLAALRELVRAWDSTTFPVPDRMEAALLAADVIIAKAEGREARQRV